MKVRFLSASKDLSTLISKMNSTAVVLIRLPNLNKEDLMNVGENFGASKLYKICELAAHLSSSLTKTRTMMFLGPTHLLPYVYNVINKKFKFINLIAIRAKQPHHSSKFLPNEHLGLIVFSTRQNPCAIVRIPYEYCKCCKRTLKDYGAKTHLLDSEGTRVSDVWKDIAIDKKTAFPLSVISRIEHLFSDEKEMTVLSLMNERYYGKLYAPKLANERMENIQPKVLPLRTVKTLPIKNMLINDDVLKGFDRIPDNSIDFVLVDPPYNLSITYGKFRDNLQDVEYLSWCRKWLDEICRILKKDGTLALINIPKWSLGLFPYLQQRMNFQGWIVWDAWGYPARRIIPAHYPILCFANGSALKTYNHKLLRNATSENESYEILLPQNYGYCIRNSCQNKRTQRMKSDRRTLSDLWTDVHRIRHNSFRYNHPTLMPKRLAERIIRIFTKQGDVILDCFNGVGTTTLVAQQLNRRYIGIEINHPYHKTALSRHKLLLLGRDPFEKTRAKSTSKNKGYRVVKHRKYEVTKKTLQLAVKRIAEELGHCPSEEELIKFGKYPIKYYYDNFRDWAEITVATRRTGIKS